MDLRRVGVVVVGHGQLPSDMPGEMASKYLMLKFKEGRTASEEDVFKELEQTVLRWPRNVANDPYAHSLTLLASEVARIGGFGDVWVAFNEFCSPTVEEALEKACASDVDIVVVATTMTTGGGEHSEKDIREAVEKMRNRCSKPIVYAWPYSASSVARLVVENIKQHLSSLEAGG